MGYSNFTREVGPVGRLRGKGQLGWITRQIIEESGIFNPIPETLADIVNE